MRRLLAGTRIRLTLTFAAVLAVAILVADIALYLALSRAETSAAADVLVSQASVIAGGIEDINGKVQFGTGDLPTETQQGVAVDAAIVALDGSVIQTPGQALSASTLSKIAADARKQASPAPPFDVRDSRGVPRLVYAQLLPAGQGGPAVLIVSRSIGELQSALTQTIVFLAALSVLIVLAGTLLAHRLAGNILEPVRRIASTARSLSQHELHRRVEVDVPPDELGELVETFNGMLARLEASFESLRRFTADASHELRSPLALMRSELEGTLARARTPAEYETVLRDLEAEVEHMARMVDQLLMLARADAGALQPAATNLDVADFLHETAARWRPMADRRQVQLDVDAPDSGSVAADPDLLRRVMDNLIDNATRHSPAGTAVQLTGAPTAEGWNIEVRDQGPGIPSAARAALFERFARVDDARARDGGGAGLGLALSRAIAESHGGSLQLVEPNGRGATFRLFLPRSPSSRA
ncbi:MAG: two-component system, OmpR family, heavy metal sensor histidine kinase CusS [Chloroflexota bacterium]|nr:two-component system, OmpR family, heavy metal sensor histidine kinase CusS [Chloroflexota bacterium]